MSASSFTQKEIFARLVELQKQLADNSAMGREICDALKAAAIPEDIDEDVLVNIVDSICEPFTTREVSIQRLIEVYEKMLDDID